MDLAAAAATVAPPPAAAPLHAERVLDEVAEEVQVLFKDFLETFTSDTDPEAGTVRRVQHQYLEQILDMAQHQRNTLYVDMADLVSFSNANQLQHEAALMAQEEDPSVVVDGTVEARGHLAAAIEKEFYRFEPYLRRAIQTMVREHVTGAEESGQDTKEYFVSLYNIPTVTKLRDLRTERIGKLLSMSGTVTRTSEVRPELMYGTFMCAECGTTATNIEQQFKYTEPMQCRNAACGNRNKWTLSVESSKFVDFQKVRIQENTADIPSGSMPRSIDVILRNEAVELAKAGDKCVFTGCLIVVPDVAQLHKPGQVPRAGRKSGPRAANGLQQDGITGLKQLGVRDMTYKLAFLASGVQPEEMQAGVTNIRGADATDASGNPTYMFTQAELEQIDAMQRRSTNIYADMALSIAPAVFGHENIKRGVLLMLIGGVTKVTDEDKIKLRGDINVCIVGDPSTAKSQFLKYVVGFLPRAVYASGKASSAAGLTASVAKDPETGEFCIEAGALMLADNGICCIDEFDKMDVKDQVAIHEAMEQQTISIAKAGIHATLNARASILAAANPIQGRYDMSRSLRYNVHMTPAIMSRFDLFFVVVDQCSETDDYQIARHIVGLHQNTAQAIDPPFSREELQLFIKWARHLKPVIAQDAANHLVKAYSQLRSSDMRGGKSFRITTRQLESMVRLAEAYARITGESEVSTRHVREAERLLKCSILPVTADPIELEAAPAPTQDAAPASDADADDEDEATAPTDTPAASRQATIIDYDQYQRIAAMLCHQLRRQEARGQQMTGAELREWYLQEIQDQLPNEEAALQAAELVTLVIQRLSEVDHVIMVLARPGEDDDDVDPDAGIDDAVLGVHPNFVL